MHSASPLPEGTVTFLFTDIEGSTRLLQQQGDRYPDLLLEHRRLLRAAVRAWGGHEVLTEGDSFFVTFAQAPEALAAAVAAQRTLTAHPWPDGAPVRVRMGLHTGEATLGEGGYIGLDVHRAARIGAAGHGGQILLSQRTRDLVAGELPAGVTLQDLGGHRLKDLLQPEHLFQAVIDGLSQEFPPLRSLDAHPNNLPLQVSSFVGREQDLAGVKGLLARRPTGGRYPAAAGEVPARLVTLTGAGGCGKTRLALQVAADLLEEFADGVWLVELAALAEAALVPQAVASALHLREEPGHTLTETVIDYLQQKELLVVLDNCEHLIGACAELAERLVRQCPRVALLATSREALGIPGEVALRVPSLPVPDPERLDAPEADRLAAVTQYAGVRLFLDRAFVHHPGLTVASADAPVLAQVCQRLDGIPLAIELAAARVKVLSLEQIAARLDDRFRLLTGGSRTALPRQQTLRALIDWSYDLLTEAERLLLRRLSVFAGGWTLAAAEAVCAADEIEAWDVLDLLSRLVDKSLVLVEEGAGREARYRLLETIRQYGAQHLRTASEEIALRDRHRDWCLELAERAKPELAGRRQAEWLERLEREHDNLRAALSWSAERGEAAPGPGPAHEADRGLRLAGALHQLWMVRGYPGEGRERLAGLLALPGAAARTAARAQALNAAGALAWQQSDYEAARALCEESLAIRRDLGDQRGIAASLLGLGMVARNQGDYAAAGAMYEESLTIQRALGDPGGIATTLRNLGYVAGCQGDYQTARTLLEEGLAILREIGDQRGIALALDGLGGVAYYQEEYERTRALYEESLAIQRALGDKWNTARLLHNIGTVAIRQGDYTAARALYAEGLEIQRKLGDKRGISYSLAHLGEVATLQGDYPAARALQAESLVIRRQMGDKLGIAYSLEGLALLAGAQGQAMRAGRLFGAAAALRDAIHAPLGPAERAEYEQHVAATRAALGEAAFAAAWAEGQGMTLEDAVTCALGEDLAA